MPISWKRGKLGNRAYPPNNSYLQQELKHIQNVLNIYNDFPMWIIKQIMKEVKERQKTLVTTHIGTPL